MLRILVMVTLAHLATSKSVVRVAVDAGDRGEPFPHYWKRAFGSGHTLLGTRADWQSHLQRVRNEVGLEGVRMHGIFDDDMSVAPQKDKFYFYNVDQVYDNLVALGIRPIVELSFMPKSFVTCGGKEQPPCDYAFGDPGSYKGLRMPPDDFNDWYRLVKALAEHFVERYGLAEVSQWHFEVWNELWGMPYPTDYLPLYNASARALKNVSPLLRVGGPATMQLQYVKEFLDDTQRLEYPVDFVSSHLYPSDPNCTEAGGEGLHDPDCFAHLVGAARDMVHRHGFPFMLTEYKEGLQGGPGFGEGGPHADMSYAASFVFRNIPLLTGLDLFSWWTFTDIFEEGWQRGTPFYGGYGALTTQGVAKPVYRAFQLLAKAGALRIRCAVQDDDQFYKPPATSTISAFATVDEGSLGCHGLQLYLANFGPEKGASGVPWVPEPRDVRINITQCTATSATIYTVDDNCTNPYALWKAWKEPQYPTAQQITELEAASAPCIQIVPVTDNCVHLHMLPYAAVHVLVS